MEFFCRRSIYIYFSTVVRAFMEKLNVQTNVWLRWNIHCWQSTVWVCEYRSIGPSFHLYMLFIILFSYISVKYFQSWNRKWTAQFMNWMVECLFDFNLAHINIVICSCVCEFVCLYLIVIVSIRHIRGGWIRRAIHFTYICGAIDIRYGHTDSTTLYTIYIDLVRSHMERQQQQAQHRPFNKIADWWIW